MQIYHSNHYSPTFFVLGRRLVHGEVASGKGVLKKEKGKRKIYPGETGKEKVCRCVCMPGQRVWPDRRSCTSSRCGYGIAELRSAAGRQAKKARAGKSHAGGTR